MVWTFRGTYPGDETGKGRSHRRLHWRLNPVRGVDRRWRGPKDQKNGEEYTCLLERGNVGSGIPTQRERSSTTEKAFVEKERGVENDSICVCSGLLRSVYVGTETHGGGSSIPGGVNTVREIGGHEEELS